VDAHIAGLDVGSRSIELVVLDSGGEVVRRAKAPTTFHPAEQVALLLDGQVPPRIVATGYGRDLVAGMGLAAEVATVTEITAYARGAAALYPGARSILDIGGQDTKAILLGGPAGKVLRFEMNDRCAAGTGKFLEHVAGVFQIPIAEFGPYALRGEPGLAINTMCTVFAETEATSLMARGHRPADIALGLHAAIVRRTATMLRRIGFTPPLLFAGGVARNPCMVRLLAEVLGCELLRPEEPDHVGALGAALSA
jgi:predicted CoA-substrate-specific enzyme activase